MNFKLPYTSFILYFLLSIFAFFINFYYSNIGLYPIDTFSFFDTGYLITKGYHPIKDYWVISGILIDYIQSLFFYIFGANWNAYVFHSSTINACITILFFFFLNNFIKNLLLNFILSISFSILCYPVAGTPFSYQHALIFSLASILIFTLAVNKSRKIYWKILPTLMVASFLCMQLPSGLINLIILFFIFVHYVFIDKKFLKYFLEGSIYTFILLGFYFILTQVPIRDFLIQIIFFPLEFGSSRILGKEEAYQAANLVKKFTSRGVVGHFKFINVFILMNFICLFILISKKKKFFNKKILINLFILFCTIAFIFHQLITANQTFIFSLIPILCAYFIIQLKDFFNIENKKINIFFIIYILFVTAKYNDVYNSKRKFMDLQNINLNNAVSAKKLSNKFNELKWITPIHYSSNPNKEISLLKKTIDTIKNNEEKELMVITHYQFFSLILEKKLNIPNRWYFPNNNTYPSTNESKFRDHYFKRFNNILNKKKIKTIYVVESRKREFKKINFEYLLQKKCYKKNRLNEMLYEIRIMNCS